MILLLFLNMLWCTYHNIKTYFLKQYKQAKLTLVGILGQTDPLAHPNLGFGAFVSTFL